jgi:hypothetical protein
MDATVANTVTSSEQNEHKLPKNCKENRYYYKHREEILEKRRLARLAKKGIEVNDEVTTVHLSLEERRKKKMEFLGLLEVQK